MENTAAAQTDVIIALSDLHLGPGTDTRTGLSDSLEQFHRDEAFARLIDVLLGQAGADGRPRRLLLLGDLFDLPRLGAALRAPRSPSDADFCAMVDRALAGHAPVAEALRRAVAAGHRLDIVPGNHDLALMRPAVFQRLVRVLGADETGQIGIHPWLFYSPGLLYAEHGQQYHDINAAPALLRLASEPEAPVLGALFDEFVLGRLSRTDGSSERHRWRGAVNRVAAVTRLLTGGIRAVLRARRSLPPADLERYRARELRRYAAEVGLPEDALRDIDAISRDLTRALPRRIVGAATIGPLRRALSPFGLHIQARTVGRDATSTRMQSAARRIDGILRDHDAAVPFYLFGHTHRAEDRPLSSASQLPRYIDTGTWLDLPPADRPTEPNVQLTFAEIRGRGPNDARLLVWDDAGGAIRLVGADGTT